MADLKISQLESFTFAEMIGSDLFAIVDLVSGETKKITVSELDLRWQGVPAGGTDGQVISSLAGLAVWKTLTRNDVGLPNVNNTSDINKPISNAVAAALGLKANASDLAAKANIVYVDNQLALKQDALPAGINGQVLTLVGGLPQWTSVAGGGGSWSIAATVQNVGPAGKVNITSAARQVVKVAAVTDMDEANASPFNSVPATGSEIMIMGTDSAKTAVYKTNDVDYGLILTADFYATRFATCTVFYDNVLKRFFETTRTDMV